MSEQLLTLLTLSLLGLLYLFLFRVVRAVWAELAPPRPAELVEGAGRAGRGGRRAPTVGETKGRKGAKPPKLSRLTVVEPAEQKGLVYTLDDEVTIGRAGGCAVTVDDSFVSQMHARVFRRDGQVLVEDLGSTNGTFLGKQQVSGPRPMRKGDRLKVGNTVLELS